MFINLDMKNVEHDFKKHTNRRMVDDAEFQKLDGCLTGSGQGSLVNEGCPGWGPYHRTPYRTVGTRAARGYTSW